MTIKLKDKRNTRMLEIDLIYLKLLDLLVYLQRPPMGTPNAQLLGSKIVFGGEYTSHVCLI